MKYPLTKGLISRPMTEPSEELPGTNLAFTHEPTYEADRMTRGRKRIIGFKFTLLRKQDGKIPEYWLQNNAVARVVASLRAWMVIEWNIDFYLEDIGTTAANRLIYEWQLKENSDKRIDNRVAANIPGKCFIQKGKWSDR